MEELLQNNGRPQILKKIVKLLKTFQREGLKHLPYSHDISL